MALRESHLTERAGPSVRSHRGGRRLPFNLKKPLSAVSLFWEVALTSPSLLRARIDEDLVGRRVMITHGNLTLRSGNEVLDHAHLDVFYRVERASGTSLWLRSEGTGPSGWVHADQVIPVEKAVEFFTEQMRAEPRDWFPYVMRARVWGERKEFEHALRDYAEAIKLGPDQANTYNHRGISWYERKEYDKAASDFDVAIRLDPKLAVAYNNRGLVSFQKKLYDKAIADYTEAI
jgi:tetratricopeptide (TPR) repeat protein